MVPVMDTSDGEDNCAAYMPDPHATSINTPADPTNSGEAAAMDADTFDAVEPDADATAARLIKQGSLEKKGHGLGAFKWAVRVVIVRQGELSYYKPEDTDPLNTLALTSGNVEHGHLQDQYTPSILCGTTQTAVAFAAFLWYL